MKNSEIISDAIGFLSEIKQNLLNEGTIIIIPFHYLFPDHSRIKVSVKFQTTNGMITPIEVVRY